jgi:5-methylthioadenosine/S-adenosylhomocysteine deaminase
MTTAEPQILITNGRVLTVDGQNNRFDPGALAVCGGRIQAVGPASRFSGRRFDRVIDVGGGIVMPGLVNVHTHAAMTCFRGLADDLPLMQWLQEYIFPAETLLDEDMVYQGTLLACAEMIRSGTTCFCDMYLFEDAVARAARDAGMRAVVGEVLYDFPSPNYGPIENGFAYTEKLIQKWRGHDRIGIAVEPHSPYLCDPELLRQAAAMAYGHRIPMVIHVAETASEVEQLREKTGRTPVGLLADLGVLGPNLLACHCVVVSDEDIALLRRFDVKVAHNPESNMKLASGVAPVPAMLQRGVCIGLGTDGCASNNNLDLFGEMNTAAKLHKAWQHDPTVLDAAAVLRMATIDGARALGLGAICGSLEAGKRADLIVVDVDRPHLTPMYDPLSHLIYAVQADDVTMVMIQGDIVMENGRLLTLDEEQVMAAVRRIGKRVGNPKG